MWSVNPPTFTVSETATLCAGSIGDKSLAERVLAARDNLSGNSDRLRKAIGGDATHLVDNTSFPVVDELSASEMGFLYTGQFVPRTKPARAHYDKIILAAPHGLCCYCQYGYADTIDHVIPKVHVPALAIDPWNLVPCCGPCNHTLGETHSDQPEKQLLHPYAMPALGRWLRARVIEQAPIVLQFTAEPAAELTEILQQRIHNEFAALHLADKYSVVSAQQITTTNRTLSRQWRSEDHETVRAYLHELACDAAGPDVNDRRAVVYQALADSEWYCQEGFLT
ncbi:hypothetical protein AB0L82_31145 [Nocardia sp. NPDC052001]|uniref:HNH endonuclease n=1 Tax=Nocardia sp. NPDC052001 TaxID=3154853 RepID=UPI00342F0969